MQAAGTARPTWLHDSRAVANVNSTTAETGRTLPGELLMPLLPVDAIDDPRLDPYRNLKDRQLAQRDGLFIAEGDHLVRRLLASDYATHSVLLTERRAPGFAHHVPPEVPVYIVPEALTAEIVGYPFHRGIMACGRRQPDPKLDDVLASTAGALLLVICPTISNCENLGAIVRVAGAFGADAMILGANCCDAFARRTLRVSMGTVLRMPIVRSADLRRDLIRLRESFGVDLIASVLDTDAQPLERLRRPDRMGLLIGNEANGLDAEWIEACPTRVTIPMQLGTDSLNVAVATAVMLYSLTRIAKPARGNEE